MSRGSSFTLAKNTDQIEKKQGYELVGSNVLENYGELFPSAPPLSGETAEEDLASKY